MDASILTTAQAARILGVSVRTVQLWVEGGTLTSWKTPGGHRRIRSNDVLALLNEAKPTAIAAPQTTLVTVLAATSRLQAYCEALAPLIEFHVELFDNHHAAALSIGAGLPAVLIIELDVALQQRLDLLRQVAIHPALRHTRVIAIGAAREHEVVAQLPAGWSIAFLPAERDLAQLQTVLRTLLVGTAADRAPMLALPYPTPVNEAQRAAAVERSGLLDTLPEERFDRLTWLAAHVLEMPVALLTLLTPTRQWFKSHHGIDVSETPREWAFCNYTIMQKGVFAIADLTLDQRFTDNPIVNGPPAMRFYAGAALTDRQGYTLGSLCIMDRKPRTLDDDQRKLLSTLAAITSDEIKLSVSERELQWSRSQLAEIASRPS